MGLNEMVEWTLVIAAIGVFYGFRNQVAIHKEVRALREDVAALRLAIDKSNGAIVAAMLDLKHSNEALESTLDNHGLLSP